ncbi:phage gp6-like head-tail connector protein [Acinetobacter baumannii]|nr:phage gp6-like head-tail connector protein [Acinetobacter baumannii]
MITLERAKLQCRVDHDDEDVLFLEWMAQADEEIAIDIDRKIISNESERTSDTDIVDCKKLDNARLIFIEYKYSRSLEGKPQAYWDILQPIREMGV